MKNNGKAKRAARKAEAIARQAERATLSNEEQLVVLDDRPGYSLTERAKLLGTDKPCIHHECLVDRVKEIRERENVLEALKDPEVIAELSS